jgi:aspartyl-tRNA(Asn)/glutamyl-tRNA(Gln) amidotransferase subunit B
LSSKHSGRRTGFGGGRYFFSSTSSSSSTSRRDKESMEEVPSSFHQWTVDPRTGIVSSSRQSFDSTTKTKEAMVTPTYQVIVGFEIHVQLSTPSLSTAGRKLLSSSAGSLKRSAATVKPNDRFHPFDAAVPGYLPLLLQGGGNSSSDGSTLLMMEKAVTACLLCHSHIQPVSRFERKHYYYADLPHGYQVTQQRWPLAVGGYLPLSTSGGAGDDKDDDVEVDDVDQQVVCRIERIQLEMDTAKTTATTNTSSSSTPVSWIDLDRAGMPLLEIVTKPDIRSPIQATQLVQHLHSLLTRCHVTRGRLERGEYRMDVNVNVECLQSGKRSHRVEVKNLNSFSHVQQSIVYEAVRQASEWRDHHDEEEKEGKVSHRAVSMGPETRTWDAALAQTVLMRSKDTAQEYRFLPELDLPPVHITSTFVDRVRTMIPELPRATRQRLVQQYGIPPYQAGILANEVSAVDAVRLFEDTCRHLLRATNVSTLPPPSQETTSVLSSKVATTVANLIANELFALVQPSSTTTTSESLDRDGARTQEEEDERLPGVLEAWQLAEIVSMLNEGVISLAIAKKVLASLVVVEARAEPGQVVDAASCAAASSPRQLVQDMGWQLMGDREELLQMCRQVLKDHPKQAAEYAACEKNLLSHAKGPDAGKARRNQQRLLKLFMGKAMSASRGNAHPERLQEALQDALEEMVSTAKSKE